MGFPWLFAENLVDGYCRHHFLAIHQVAPMGGFEPPKIYIAAYKLLCDVSHITHVSFL